jgi:hypothetical protein
MSQNIHLFFKAPEPMSVGPRKTRKFCCLGKNCNLAVRHAYRLDRSPQRTALRKRAGIEESPDEHFDEMTKFAVTFCRRKILEEVSKRQINQSLYIT